MSYAISLQSTYSDGNAPLTGTTTTTAGVLAEVQHTATASSTTTADFSYKATAMKSIYILYSGAALNAGDTVVLTTYAALKGAQGSALDTITLTNGVPFLWILNAGTNPMQVVTNILSIKAVNGVARTGTIEIRVGYDS